MSAAHHEDIGVYCRDPIKRFVCEGGCLAPSSSYDATSSHTLGSVQTPMDEWHIDLSAVLIYTFYAY